MINECVAKGDYLNYFSKKNTTIIHCPLSIVHSLDRAINWDFCVMFIIIRVFLKSNGKYEKPERDEPLRLLLQNQFSIA